MADEEEVRDNILNTLRRHERHVERQAKKLQDARKAHAAREVAQRDLELRRCVEMDEEEKWSRKAALRAQLDEKRELEIRRKAEEEKLLVLLTAARKGAKSAGAVLSTPGMRGQKRLVELTDRRVDAIETAEQVRVEIAAKLRLRYDTKRAQTAIGARVDTHCTALMEAAILHQKWEDMLHLIHVSHQSPDFETPQGFTPLVMALSHKKPSVARRLLDAGASVDLETKWGKTALLAAIVADDIDGVRLCLTRGANPRAESSAKVTPLLLAVDKGRAAIVRALLLADDELLNAANSDGAALSQQAAAARVLFENGAALAVRGKDGRTCLEWAKRCMFHMFADLLETLSFEAGFAGHADEDARHERGNADVLARADLPRLLSLVESGRLPPNFESATGLTPLVVVCTKGTLAQVQTLLALGAIAWHETRTGQSPLLVACDRGAADIITCLVNAGASFAAVDTSGANGFLHLREFPDLVAIWTRFRGQFQPAVPLGVPTRVAVVTTRHSVPLQQGGIQVRGTEIRVSPPSTPAHHPPSPDDNRANNNDNDGDEDEGPSTDESRGRRWHAQRTGLRQNRKKLVPFYEEREKILQAQARGRRNAVCVPKRDANQPSPTKGRLCENCLRVRATVTCNECRMVFCDRCVMERHYGPGHHHHTTEPLVAPVVVEVIAPEEERLSVQKCRDVVGTIRGALKLASNQTMDVDIDIRLRLLREKRDEDAKHRAAIMDFNVPKLAARLAQAKGEGNLFAKPSEIFLARNCVKRGLFDKAIKLLEAALAIQVESFGSLHPLVGHTFHELAAVRKAQGNGDEWTDRLLDALECFDDNFDCDHVDVVTTVRELLESWESRKKFKDAWAFARVVELKRRKVLGDAHELTVEMHDRGAALLAKWEMLQMFLQDSVGQRLLDRATNAEYYAETALGRLPEQLTHLLTQDTAGLECFAPFCKARMHDVNLQFWLAVETFKEKCRTSSDVGFSPHAAARDIFNEFIKSMKIKCTTVATRNHIRAFLRSEKRGAEAEVFDGAQTLVFHALYTSVYLPFLDTPEGET
ncbi:Aste57867_3369 [Aphanomyces stellatus]|uniref:Aste57867_3369 protein n=1 Tax=Aphanomyces stellatus TaxID=120398 RepID=A0A485KB85_9STRA|nr:hypothetical protein As57867_003359 [Aphanomyces stellatus]VFT80535.1 Aste57867_3369 [Aphanomyces stellatus]